MITKQCSRCKEEKPKTNEFFPIDNKYSPKGTIYYASRCRKCCALISEERRIKGLHLKALKKYQSSQKGKDTQYKVNQRYNNKLGGGVYGIFCDKGNCLYIGASSQIQMRFSIHQQNIRNPFNAEKHHKE